MSEGQLQRWRNGWVRRLNLALARAISASAISGKDKKEPSEVTNLLSAMNYTIESGGKRLRALFALAASGAVGGQERWALPAALAIEMIHAYSLIHDDLPALDNDDLRRGRPTCHLAYGEATAILAGDALQSLAFEILASSAISGLDNAHERICQATLILARSIGPLGMAGGQAMDLAFEGSTPALDQVMIMEEKKSGYLIGASLAIGATMGGADRKTVARLESSGRQAGLAFQIMDDLLNLTGDPIKMGKNVGTDTQMAKASVPAVIGQADALSQAEALIDNALAKINNLGSKKLEWLLSSTINRSS